MKLRARLRSLTLRGVLCGALALGALGCGAAFRDAMERGDRLAQAGSWDAAASSYETAVRLDPDSQEARAKLREARRRQSAIRAAGSRWHLARGEFALAVRAAREALTLDPESAEARAAFAEAKGKALERAEALFAEKKLNEALDLARAVRVNDPADPRAAALEGRCLDAIADQAYDRAIAYIAANKRGNAWLALREVEAARPGYRDAAARAQAARRSLEDEVRFLIVVERAPPADRSPLASRVESTLLRWKPDARFRLSAAIEGEPPPGAQAVRVWPKLGKESRGHEVAGLHRSCEYVCGVDRVPNPQHEVASRRASEAERRMHLADAGLGRARRALERANQEVTAAAAALTAAEGQEKAARIELDACSSKKKKPGDSCSAEEARLDAAKRASESASERDRSARQGRSNAEGDHRDAESERSNARRDWDRSLSELSSTPTTMLIDRVCVHNYGVDAHTFSAAVTLSLGVHVLGEPAPVELPPTALGASFRDEAFPAQPGRCVEVAAGDPLRPPSDLDIEVALSERAVGYVEGQVATWYASYVESYRVDYEDAKAAGRAEDANEAYVRYRLVGPGLDAR